MAGNGPEPWLLDPSNRLEIERYLVERRLVPADSLPVAVQPAGAGNMNVTLRVTPASGRPFIVKQGRPWVAKYPQIPAPFERTLVEAAFYDEVRREPAVSRRMPGVLYVDQANHVIVLEDVGAAGDFTPIYAGEAMPVAALTSLLDWLARLAAIEIPADRRKAFANRGMRELNHEHLFCFPLREGNGLDLDAITPGLRQEACLLADDPSYCAAVALLGVRYLADEATLVHGDYFPGSWLRAAGGGVRVIDPEFCFLGEPEFDYGILAGHLILAGGDAAALEMVSKAVDARGLVAARVAGYAGVEIMRRLIGVAQLPLSAELDRKQAWLRHSRRLVLEPHNGLA